MIHTRDLSKVEQPVLAWNALVSALTRRFRTSVEDATVDAHTFSILKPANSDDLIREEDFVKDERLPYWADVWPSSLVLAGKLLELEGRGRTALELGCGVGLSTLAAATAGYDVRVAEDAITAGHLVLKNPPDLIITDVNMPHMDGFEFVAALKSDLTLPYIPVIFLTSTVDGDHRGKELGAVGYLTKPVRADQLVAMVAQHLPRER